MPIKVRTDGAWVQVSDGTDGVDGTSNIPSGTIVMYNNYSAPTGWSLCDGQDGRPDLRDKFIVGASSAAGSGDTTYPGLSWGATGGYTSVFIPEHTHTVSVDSAGGHTHTYNTRSVVSVHSYGDSNQDRPEKNTVSANTGSSGGHTHTGTAAKNTGGAAITNEQRDGRNLPPYFALTFIIKD